MARRHHPLSGTQHPTLLHQGMLDSLLQSYASATRRADRLGMDLIEIHSAHGHLLHSFLSPLLGCDYISASSGGSVPEQKIVVQPG
jgi:2,4-dienoyl-CoA reductase-like NADH-dependent reductase (Old Yellow Enzyme family)